MKNFEFEDSRYFGKKLKLLLIMKLIFLLTVVCFLQTSATVYSQATKFSFELKNQRIQDVLREIEKNSDFRFFYQREQVDVEQIVNLNITDKTIEEILPELFKGQEVVFDVRQDNLILIKPEQGAIESSTEFYAQQQNFVSGKVTDTGGQPLPGVTVLVKGTAQGTVTNADGNYTVTNVPDNAILQFSFVGMKTQEIVVGIQTIINVSMEEETIGIEEVVAIGYGTQTRREISGSVANISERNFNKGMTQNAVDLLKGKVAGLVITQGSGDITRGQTIRLRGTSSLTGSSEPFIVIDGVPGMSLNTVAPHDIESISVLKDASAAAIYGSRSASGVILVTTKKGKRDFSLAEYDGYVAMSTVTNVPQVLNAAEWRDYASKNRINVTGLDKGANTDWFDQIMRTGVSHNHSFSLSGGGKNSSYRASISYQGQEGVVKDNQVDRKSVV